jgi:hypothetical protein
METIELTDKIGGITERDTFSKAILNTDLDAYKRYKIRVQQANARRETNTDLNNVKEQVAVIQEDIRQIHTMIKQLLLSK